MSPSVAFSARGYRQEHGEVEAILIVLSNTKHHREIVAD